MRSYNVFIWLFVLVVGLNGCASEQAYQNYLAAFNNASDNNKALAEQPLLDVTLPAPEGKEYKIVVNRDYTPMSPQQIKDSEWVPVAASGTNVLSNIFGGWFSFLKRKSDNEADVKIARSDNEADVAKTQAYTDALVQFVPKEEPETSEDLPETETEDTED